MDLRFGPPVPPPTALMGAGIPTLQAAQSVYNDRLLKKWDWLLEGRPAPDGAAPIWQDIPERMRIPLAQMFENQTILVNAHLQDTSKSTVAVPTQYALPMIRKAYAGTVASRVCGWQPLSPTSGGVGNIFYLSFYREYGGDVEFRTTDSTYANSTEGAVPKKVRITVTTEAVTALKRILAASWSSESYEDAMGALGLNIEAEIIDAAAKEIAREIDKYVLSMMLQQATAGNTDWSQTVDTGYKSFEWYRTLGQAVITAGDNIASNVLKREQWVIGGTNFVSFFKKAEEFVIEPMDDAQTRFLSGVERIGRVNKKWDLYESYMIPATKALVSYYPESNMDTPVILSPYIPLDVMPLVYASFDADTGAYANTDAWTRNIRTRQAEKVVTPAGIATITVTA